MNEMGLETFKMTVVCSYGPEGEAIGIPGNSAYS
jgi:hypothetical protein